MPYVAQLHAAWWAWADGGRERFPELPVCFAALAGLGPLHGERQRARGGRDHAVDKPQNMAAVMGEARRKIAKGTLVVSIAAGVTLAKLCAGLKTDRVIRVMPNTPALIGKGASAFALGPGATAEDSRLVGGAIVSGGARPAGR